MYLAIIHKRRMWLVALAIVPAVVFCLLVYMLPDERSDFQQSLRRFDDGDFRRLQSNSTESPTSSACLTSSEGPVQNKECRLPFLYKRNSTDPGTLVENCVSALDFPPFGVEGFPVDQESALWCATNFATYILNDEVTQGLWGFCSCTSVPTMSPSESPTTLAPSQSPTPEPTATPTKSPTRIPTFRPTPRPTQVCAIIPVFRADEKEAVKEFWPTLQQPLNADAAARNESEVSLSVASNGDTCAFPFLFNGTEQYDCIDAETPIANTTEVFDFSWCLAEQSVGTASVGLCGCSDITDPPVKAPVQSPTASPQTFQPTMQPTFSPTALPTQSPTRRTFRRVSFDGVVVKTRIADERNLYDIPTRSLSNATFFDDDLATNSSSGNITDSPTAPFNTSFPTAAPSKAPTAHPTASPSPAPTALPTAGPTAHPTSRPTVTVGYCRFQCHITRLFEAQVTELVHGDREKQGISDVAAYDWRAHFRTQVVLEGPGSVGTACTQFFCRLEIAVVILPALTPLPTPQPTVQSTALATNTTIVPTTSPSAVEYQIPTNRQLELVRTAVERLVSPGSELYMIPVAGTEFSLLNEGEFPIKVTSIEEAPLDVCVSGCFEIYTLQPTASPTRKDEETPPPELGVQTGQTALIATMSVLSTVLVGAALFCFIRSGDEPNKAHRAHTRWGRCAGCCGGQVVQKPDGDEPRHPNGSEAVGGGAPPHADSSSFDELSIELSKLSIQHVIGHGGNGRIFKALYCGSSVAVKELFPEVQDVGAKFGRMPIAFMREMEILRKLRHPHIIQLYGCSTATDQDTGELRYLLVMELAKYSLKDLLEYSYESLSSASKLHDSPGVSEGPSSPSGEYVSDLDSVHTPHSPPLARSRVGSHTTEPAEAGKSSTGQLTLVRKYQLAQQICAGCAYIHDNNMIHFDIKPGNILLDFAGNAKICDLGIAKLNMHPNGKVDFTASAFGGTPPYMAPELLRGDTSRIGKSVDVYAFGIILWQLFHERPSHPPDWTVARLFNEVMVNDYRPPVDLGNPEVVPVSALISACWDKDCDNRPDFHQLVKSLTVALRKTAEQGGPSARWHLGDRVLCWAQSAKSYAVGTVVVAHANGTYNVELDDASLPARAFVSSNDIIPLEKKSPDLVSNAQQTVSHIAIANIVTRNQVLRNVRRNQKSVFEPKGEEQAWGRNYNPPDLASVVSADGNAKPVLNQLAFKFFQQPNEGEVNESKLPQLGLNTMNGWLPTDNNVHSGSTTMASNPFLTLGTDASGHLNGTKDTDINSTFQFDGDSLQVQGFMVTTAGMKDEGTSSSPLIGGMGNIRNISKYWESSLVPIRRLGQGASGTVLLAFHIPTFEIVAIKQVRFSERSLRHQMVRELRVLWKNMLGVRETREKQLHAQQEGLLFNKSELRSAQGHLDSMVGAPNPTPLVPEDLPVQAAGGASPTIADFGGCEQIVLLHDAFLDTESQTVNMVLEYMDGGSLQDLIDGADTDNMVGPLEEHVLSKITRCILLAIRFLHRNHLLHLDIKPGNILVNVKGEAKLADFGLARQLEESAHFKATTFKGSARYMSPERLRGDPYSYPSDVWSLGLSLMTCVLGEYPVEPDSPPGREGTQEADLSRDSSSRAKSASKKPKPGVAYWELLALLEDGSNLLLETRDPENRYSAALKSFLRCCLALNPKNRSTAEELLRHPWIARHHEARQGRGEADQLAGEKVEAAKGLLEEIARQVVRQASEHSEKLWLLGGRQLAASEEPVELSVALSKVQRLAQQLGLPVSVVEAKLEEAAMALSCPRVADAEELRQQASHQGQYSPRRWNKVKGQESEIVAGPVMAPLPPPNLDENPVRRYQKPRQTSDSSWSQRSTKSTSSFKKTPLARVLSKVSGMRSKTERREESDEEGGAVQPQSLLSVAMDAAHEDQ